MIHIVSQATNVQHKQHQVEQQQQQQQQPKVQVYLINIVLRIIVVPIMMVVTIYVFVKIMLVKFVLHDLACKLIKEKIIVSSQKHVPLIVKSGLMDVIIVLVVMVLILHVKLNQVVRFMNNQHV